MSVYYLFTGACVLPGVGGTLCTCTAVSDLGARPAPGEVNFLKNPFMFLCGEGEFCVAGVGW